ncbi:MAG: glycoside hydrolase family 99-like domain-containing protein [Lachnospiraceae bacterium]|nr:glycoside hydrolase family 99-like domain-containing protein [Lachnospiraceae bacterium]
MKVYDRNNIQKGLEQLYAYNIYEKPTTFVEYQPKQIQNQNFLKPIAFYLPQYYATKINDKNWGAGFTEWTNVAKAVPQYLGHYQPHIPERLGYYDLRYVDIMERQSHLAAEYGLFGFCFYYYFFQGKTQLELPLLNYAYNQNIKFPFCLCWANENWTRKWDGKKQYILLEQKYEKKDMLNFISKISNYFFCENYIRVNNRPLLIIYNAMEIPDLDYYIKLWRDYCIKTGIGDIYLVCAKTFGIKVEKFINIFDAFVELE